MQAILVHDNNAKCYTAIRLHALELRGGGEPSTRNVAAMGLMKDGCAVCSAISQRRARTLWCPGLTSSMRIQVTVDGWGPSLSNAGSEEFGNVVASRDGGNLTVSGFDDCIKGNGVFLVLEPDSDPAEDPTRFIIEGKWDGHDWRQVWWRMLCRGTMTIVSKRKTAVTDSRESAAGGLIELLPRRSARPGPVLLRPSFALIVRLVHSRNPFLTSLSCDACF
eukprot:1092974-Rhodomonas_salina.3